MTDLARTERDRLDACEQTIARGLDTFVNVGRALAEIRDHMLYRETHLKFEDYCAERWGMSRRHANRMIESANVVIAVGPSGPMCDPPVTERVARELAPVLREQGEEATAATWEAAVEQHGPEPTAAQVKETVATIRAAEETTTAAPLTRERAIEIVKADDPKVRARLEDAEALRCLRAIGAAISASRIAHLDALIDRATRTDLESYAGSLRPEDVTYITELAERIARRLAPGLEAVS